MYLLKIKEAFDLPWNLSLQHLQQSGNVSVVSLL